jgi:hypothetical protein
MPPTTTSKLRDALKKAPKNQKILYGLALATLIGVFLPWMTLPFFGTSFGTVNGFQSVGFLSFLGSLGYLLWKILPIVGIKVPDFGQSEANLQKILGGLMLAGPVLWFLMSGYGFSGIGAGLIITLLSSGSFCYMSFRG